MISSRVPQDVFDMLASDLTWWVRLKSVEICYRVPKRPIFGAKLKSLQALTCLSGLTSLSFCDFGTTSGSLTPRLTEFSKLARLRLDKSPITNATLDMLVKLSQLTDLEFTWPDYVLFYDKLFLQLTNLRRLTMHNSIMTSALAEALKCCSGLEFLCCGSAAQDAKDVVQALGTFGLLRHIELSFTNAPEFIIGDPAQNLNYLQSNLPALRALKLQYPVSSAAELAALRNFTQLTQLEYSHKIGEPLVDVYPSDNVRSLTVQLDTTPPRAQMITVGAGTILTDLPAIRTFMRLRTTAASISSSSLAACSQLAHLSLDGCKVTQSLLLMLPELRHLKSLRLHSSTVEEESVVLCDLPECLTSLTISGLHFSSAVPSNSLGHLSVLQCTGCKTLSEHVAALLARTSVLESLVFSTSEADVWWTGNLSQAIAASTSLISLELRSMRPITEEELQALPAALARLSSLKKLQTLMLDYADAGQGHAIRSMRTARGRGDREQPSALQQESNNHSASTSTGPAVNSPAKQKTFIPPFALLIALQPLTVLQSLRVVSLPRGVVSSAADVAPFEVLSHCDFEKEETANPLSGNWSVW